MIDKRKWDAATREEKLQAIKSFKAVVTEEALTKQDTLIVIDFLSTQVEE